MQNAQENTSGGIDAPAFYAKGPSSVLTLTPRKYRCSVCQHETGGDFPEIITVSIDPYTGVYCLKCYAAWIAANVPKLEEISN